jgi:hypothetical protein
MFLFGNNKICLHEELPDNKYYLFGKRRSKKLSRRFRVHSWEEYLLYNPCEAGDRPAAMQASAVENIFDEVIVMLYKKR